MGHGPKKAKNTGRGKGDKAIAPTIKGLAKNQVTPPRDCRHQEARKAGRSRICCNAKVRRKAATAAASCPKRLPSRWMRYLSAWAPWCCDHGPTIQASWTHDSAYGCHKKSPHREAKRNQKQKERRSKICTTSYHLGRVPLLHFGRVIVGLIGVFIFLINQNHIRLPHDIIVEDGLPPNPGPSSSRSTGDSQEKRRRLQDIAEKERDAEDDGFSPGYSMRGKGEVEVNRTEKEQGKRGNMQNTFEKSETAFTDKKRKVGKQKEKSVGNNFSHIQKTEKGNREMQGEGKGSIKATPCL